MNCKNLKRRQLQYIPYLYCSKLKKEINFSDCTNCPYKEYKERKPIKKRSYSLAKKEKERFSIIAKDLDKCILCGKYKDSLHEIYEGRNRQVSIKYGCVIPLCYKCHIKIQHDRALSLLWKVKCQAMFEKVYPNLDFLEIFGRNYK